MANEMLPLECKLLDLAKGLLPVIESNLGKPFEEQVATWQKFYALHAPFLPERLYKDHADQEGGWMSVARDRVWPHLAERMARMKVANRSIGRMYSDIYLRAVRRLGFSEPLFVVTYVGIGNGAGWATRWEDRPAVLLGLENIAELDWHRVPSIRGLMSHEIGHLFMTSVRGGAKLSDDPRFDLYEEGFAQHCEHTILGRETWHCSSQDGWLEWCVAHEGYLAQRYLREMHDKEKRRRFFGSWFEIDGWRQTGYFLGCRLVQRMAHERTLREIAGLREEDVRCLADEYLWSFQ